MIRNAQWQKTARVLTELGVSCYIPASYRTLLFLHAEKTLALSLVNSGRIHARFLIDHGTRTLLEVPPKQMEDFMRVMEEPEAECAPGTAFAKGDKIRIIRGTLKGVAGSLIQTMRSAYGSDPENILAVIGPGIGACCFEVGFDVADAFTDKYPWAEEYVCAYSGARPHVDLKGINAELLRLEGVAHIEISEHCTCCEPDLFWSHRRCADKTRMLAFIKKGKE